MKGPARRSLRPTSPKRAKRLEALYATPSSDEVGLSEWLEPETDEQDEEVDSEGNRRGDRRRSPWLDVGERAPLCECQRLGRRCDAKLANTAKIDLIDSSRSLALNNLRGCNVFRQIQLTGPAATNLFVALRGASNGTMLLNREAGWGRHRVFTVSAVLGPTEGERCQARPRLFPCLF